MQAIGLAVTTLKTAAELAKAIYNAKLDIDLKQKVAELQQLIFDARQSAFDAQSDLATVKGQMAECKRQLADFKKWDDDKGRYALFQPQNVQAVVYSVRKSASLGEPAHYLCTNCYQKNTKSIINNSQGKDRQTSFLCPVCKAEFPTRYSGSVPAEFAPD